MRPPRAARTLTVAGLAAVLAASVVPGSSQASGQRVGGKLVPASGAIFGTTVDGPGGNGIRVGALERKIGRKLRIVQHYYGWREKFPTGIEPNMIKHGRIPMIGWRGTSLRAIASGRYNALIKRDAIRVRNFHHPIFMRWGYEMNGSWEPWSGARNGGPSGVSLFIRAWRLIHNIFVRAGATNAIWVWAPNWEDIPKDSWNHWTHYYPGDGYVDWVGIDGFNWGTSQSWSRWVDAVHFIKGLYSTYHLRKPMMLSETASVEQGGNKARWIRQTGSLIQNRYPDIAAFVYFNGTDEHQAWIIWAVTSSNAALQAWAAVGHNPYFNR